MVKKTHCGYIALIGRPNVGKSTLLNSFLGQKISIITKKPQTTRHRILGIKTEGDTQFVFVDTPGLHAHPKHKINQLMIKTASDAIHDVDCVVFIINGRYWTEDDEVILKRLATAKVPVIIAINKIDKIKEKDKLLPIVENVRQKLQDYQLTPVGVFLISAKRKDGVADLTQTLQGLLPESPHFFPPDQVTDRSERFLAAELIREKLMRILGQEVPHALTVEIELFKEQEQPKKLIHISAIIWVETQGQKVIVIGKQGERLKEIGYLARVEMERLFEQKVFLQLWVKVKAGWTDNLRALRSLGYG